MERPFILPARTSLWTGPARLVLASNSATRRLLLENAGLEVEIEASTIDERQIEQEFVKAGGAPSQIAASLARAKALDVSKRRARALCLGGDQTLLLDETILHKPSDMEAAAGRLERLSGRTHELAAAVCVACDGVVVFEVAQSARLSMRALDENTIRNYLAAAGPAILSSVGAYQIEGLGIHLFEAIEGDHATILGLPLLPLLKWFRSKRFLAL
jgi:septum formation protein